MPKLPRSLPRAVPNDDAFPDLRPGVQVAVDDQLHVAESSHNEGDFTVLWKDCCVRVTVLADELSIQYCLTKS